MSQRALALLVAVLSLAALGVAAAVVRRNGEPRTLGPDAYRAELRGALPADFDGQPADLDAVRQSRDEFRRVVDDLTEFVPPPDVAVLHSRLVSGLDEYARLLERLADAVRPGVIELQVRLAELGGLPAFDWVQAMNELAAAGYLPDPPKL